MHWEHARGWTLGWARDGLGSLMGSISLNYNLLSSLAIGMFSYDCGCDRCMVLRVRGVLYT